MDDGKNSSIKDDPNANSIFRRRRVGTALPYRGGAEYRGDPVAQGELAEAAGDQVKVKCWSPEFV